MVFLDQQKPLLLLKALIALGRMDVREEVVSDLLWPEAEGDAAHSAFSTTLSRLRDLLGVEQAIHVHEGRVSLNPCLCWVDAWAFEWLLVAAEDRLPMKQAGRTARMPGDAATLVEQAMERYRGHFLPGDESHVWTASYRERLRGKFLRSVVQRGEHLENLGNWKEATECYQRGLEVDELAEGLYQRLMCCYQALGLRGEAIAAYRRCRKLLSDVLGIEPSPKTEAIYCSLRSNDE